MKSYSEVIDTESGKAGYDRMSLTLGIAGPRYNPNNHIDWEWNNPDSNIGGWVAYQQEPGINQRSRRPDLDAPDPHGVFQHMLRLGKTFHSID
jgi:hypothetical protein